ncbi:unnamed protein product, partial [Sphacelaria rigidula]
NNYLLFCCFVVTPQGSTVALFMLRSSTVETCCLGSRKYGCTDMRVLGLSNSPRLDLVLYRPSHRFTRHTSHLSAHAKLTSVSPPPFMRPESLFKGSRRTF